MRKGLMSVACVLAWLALAPWAQAASTYRIGSRVLAVGDSAVTTSGLLGEPQYKEPIENGHGAYRGERWQYEVNGQMVTVTIVAGKVADIQIEQR